MTIRKNILFDLPMDEERYIRVIMACCLEKDFECLDAGDLSEIGERGINLSGG
jgi:ABC-type transport system involved in cytochrome bd biosynthesis fused ATPase/permease subunit